MSSTRSDNIIDSRDVIERIDELDTAADFAVESEQEELTFCLMTKSQYREETCAWLRSLGLNRTADETAEEHEADEGLDAEELAELADLRALRDQAEDCGDWDHGEALIHEDHFQDYARDMAADLGYVHDDRHWPYTCIDWEQAANDLRHDYTAVEFDGDTYYIRS